MGVQGFLKDPFFDLPAYKFSHEQDVLAAKTRFGKGNLAVYTSDYVGFAERAQEEGTLRNIEGHEARAVPRR